MFVFISLLFFSSSSFDSFGSVAPLFSFRMCLHLFRRIPRIIRLFNARITSNNAYTFEIGPNAAHQESRIKTLEQIWCSSFHFVVWYFWFLYRFVYSHAFVCGDARWGASYLIPNKNENYLNDRQQQNEQQQQQQNENKKKMKKNNKRFQRKKKGEEKHWIRSVPV